MAFFTRQDIGRVYVIRITLPGDYIVHKIGMTHSNRTTDRMMEILRSWFVKYRFVPYSELRLDMETSHPRELESHIHKILKSKQFIPNEKVEGGTEMFTDIDEFRLLRYIRNFNNDLFKTPLELSDKDYKHLCQLISP